MKFFSHPQECFYAITIRDEAKYHVKTSPKGGN